MKVLTTRLAAIVLAMMALLPGFMPASLPAAAQTGDRFQVHPQDLFGMVIRDPHYEYRTNPEFPGPNQAAQDRMGAELEEAGVRWVRMEFFGDRTGAVPAGEINWDEYDYFIREVAPRHKLKILALVNAGVVSYRGAPVTQDALNHPPDESGAEDGSNHYMRVFRGRAREIAQRYGTDIQAYEIVNEPNINWELWNATGLRRADIDPERFSTLMALSYVAIKEVVPSAYVITGGMLLGGPPNDRSYNELDWLYQVYTAPAVERYRRHPRAGKGDWNVFPWDGIGLHPYWTGPENFAPLLRAMYQQIRHRGDVKSRIWCTEIGVNAPANPPELPPSDAEVSQAEYLRGIYGAVLDNPDLVAAVHTIFWFKYEDFPAPNPSAHYGIVRLRESATGYDVSGAPFVRKQAFRAYQELARPGGAPLANADPEAAAAEGGLYFAQTRKAIAPEFVSYWQAMGGLRRFGYPVTQPALLNGYKSQLFQRAVFEYHPENAGTEFEVLLRRLGAEIIQEPYPESQPFESAGDRVYFPETGHSLSGVFLEFWRGTGGLPIYGYPLSEPVEEVSRADGKTYLVQYFERNRLEYHPENAGTEFEIQMGLLGSELLKRDLWWR